MTTDFAAARLNMVESQVRPNGVTDHRILAAMGDIAREEFVPAGRRPVAYVDDDVLVSEGPPARYLMEAMVLGRLLQLAEIKATDKVLDVGAGTGYGAAVLSRLTKKVVALESDRALAAGARSKLSNLENVAVHEGVLAEGVAAEAPFDAIIFEGRIGELPQALAGQLAEGGRIVVVIGERDQSRAALWTLSGKNLARRDAFDASVKVLPGFERKKPAFVF
jgi:protein-L-isoaspartate(D-aspartate) O-methyltransferase